MKTVTQTRSVNLIGGPLPLWEITSTEIEVWDNPLFTIWPVDILVPFGDRFARYLMWLPGHYIWADFSKNLTVMNRIRVDKIEGFKCTI